MSRYESSAERAVREAQERGEFDHLPGTGKPIPGLGRRHDPDWWIKGKLEREQVSVLPPSLELRRQVAQLPELLAEMASEGRVRALVADTNELVRHSHRSRLDGPPVFVRTLDVEETVARWRQGRRDLGRPVRP